jgi:hypothetical protein
VEVDISMVFAYEFIVGNVVVLAVVRMVVDTVVETVEVDDVTAPFVLVFIQS